MRSISARYCAPLGPTLFFHKLKKEEEEEEEEEEEIKEEEKEGKMARVSDGMMRGTI